VICYFLLLILLLWQVLREPEPVVHRAFKLVAKESQKALNFAVVRCYIRAMNRSGPMKKSILVASVLALSVFALPVNAAEGDGNQGGTMKVPAIDPALLKRVEQFLASAPDLQSTPAAELQQRVKVGNQYASMEALSPNVRKQLLRESQAAQNELNRRKAAAKEKEQTEPKATTKRRVTVAEQPEAGVEDPDQPVPVRPRRSTGAEQPEAVVENGDEPTPVRPRRSTGADVAVDGGDEQRGVVEAPSKPRRPVAETNTTVSNTAEEQAALKLLQDQRPPQRLEERDLARRLATARSLLQSGKVTERTRRRLGDMIRADREVVRVRQEAQNKAEENKRNQEARARNKDNKPKFNVDINIDLRPQNEVLRDRRRAEELSQAELRQRIQIYRDVENEGDYQRYDVAERRYWRDQMLRDREYLRRQMFEERRRREVDLEGRNREIVINVRPEPSDEIDVFAAEADDEQIEDVLVAAPRERVQRRYQVEEVANDVNLRRSIPRVEVDTIRFGTAEAIVREEEVSKLDRIGSVLERILRGHPREVFLIEGHTDAVGSDVYNLGLSRARAEAVKQALTTYYNIPPENLRTVGLGERFLKVPTYESEVENRRVSIGRITAYVGENG
jgi:outer membrane protein OmpA-like peptidoglycan-associated protein